MYNLSNREDTTFHTFVASGYDRTLLVQTLDFLLKHLGYDAKDINGFFIGEDMQLILCHFNEKTRTERDCYKEYPFTVNTNLLADHILQYIHELDMEELDILGAHPDEYVSDYDIGWCIYTPSHDLNVPYEINIIDYKPYVTILAAKPWCIEYSK